MKNNEPEMSDDLRPEYDLAQLRVRRLGPKRTGFGGVVRLAPDVEQVFPNSESVNEALRFLIRITRQNKPFPISENPTPESHAVKRP
jgi:hypothetical protein